MRRRIRAADQVVPAGPDTVPAGHYFDARGGANRRGVTGLEAHAAGGEGVEVRRLVVRVAVAGEFFGAEIVGEDDDEIERTARGRVRGGNDERDDQQRDEESHHGPLVYRRAGAPPRP